MSHIAYKLALIRRDQLLREAADRRLATDRTRRGQVRRGRRAAAGRIGSRAWSGGFE